MTKVHVISGFLGAGKTSFIKQLLHNNPFSEEKVVIIENEFGQVNIDAALLENESIPLYEITEGCLCCSLQNDFVLTMSEIWEKIRPDRIIIEPSGIFMLETFFELMKKKELADKFDVGSVLTLLDGTLFDGQIIRMEMMIAAQIHHADHVLITKTNEIDKTMLNKAKTFARYHNQTATISSFNQCLNKKTIHQLFTSQASVNHKDLSLNIDHDVMMSETIQIPQGLTTSKLESLVNALRANAFGDIIRWKGIIEVDRNIYECQYTNGKFKMSLSDSDQSGIIVMIGKDMDLNKIRSCIGLGRCDNERIAGRSAFRLK